MATDSDFDIDDIDNWLDDQDGSGAELWDPKTKEQGGEPGEDRLVGKFLRYETRYSGKMNRDVKVAIIEERGTGSLYAVWLSRQVLASEYERQDPQPADWVAHKYHGLKTPRRGDKQFHSYTVRVLRSAATATPTVSVATATTVPVTPAPREAEDVDDDTMPL